MTVDEPRGAGVGWFVAERGRIEAAGAHVSKAARSTLWLATAVDLRGRGCEGRQHVLEVCIGADHAKAAAWWDRWWHL